MSRLVEGAPIGRFEVESFLGEGGIAHCRILSNGRHLIQQDWRLSAALVAVAAVVRAVRRPALRGALAIIHHLKIARARRVLRPIV